MSERANALKADRSDWVHAPKNPCDGAASSATHATTKPICAEKIRRKSLGVHDLLNYVLVKSEEGERGGGGGRANKRVTKRKRRMLTIAERPAMVSKRCTLSCKRTCKELAILMILNVNTCQKFKWLMSEVTLGANRELWATSLETDICGRGSE